MTPESDQPGLTDQKSPPVAKFRQSTLRSRDPLLGLALIALTVAVYIPAFRGGFIWDDDSHLTQNPCIVGPLGLKDIWTSRAARICPLVQTTFWFEHAIWGFNPLPYHIVNVLVHAACAVALWRVLRSLCIRGAWFGAALWALHPVQAETAAWITELKNTQSCFFYLLAIFFFVKSKRLQQPATFNRSYWLYAASLFCAALAMASKSSTVVLAVVLGLSVWWIDGQWEWRKAAKIVPFLFISFAASLLSIWTQHLEGANDPEYARSWLERIAVAGKVVWFYLGKLAWPHPLIFIYPRWEIDPSNIISYLPTAGVGLLLFICWWNRNGKLRPIFFAFAYFLVALFPVLGLLDHYFLRYSFVGDHFQYLASIGPLAVAAAGITTAFGLVEKGRRFLTPVFSGALLSLLGVITWSQCAIFANTEALWRATISRNPQCWMALNNLSILLLEKNRPDEAMIYCNEAIKLRPTYAEFHITLGNALLALQRPDEAIDQYETALGLRFDAREVGRGKAYYNLGNALLRKERIDEAIVQYQKALQFRADYTADAHNNLADALLRRGDVDDAISHYEAAVQLRTRRGKGELATAEYNLANAFVAKGQTDEAIACFQKALALRPNYADAHNNLGRLLIGQHRFADAVAHYEKALELDPESILFQNNVAWQLATCPDQSVRNGPKAVALAAKANQLSNGQDPVVLNTLAAAYAENGQFPEAIETAEHALRLIDPVKDSGLGDVLRETLALYRSATPYHQEPR